MEKAVETNWWEPVVDFFVSSTAPWWAGALFVVIGGVVGHFTAKKGDERKFAEERHAREGQRTLDKQRLTEQRAYDVEQERLATVRTAIVGLVAASEKSDKASWALHIHPSDMVRADSFVAMGELTTHFSKIQLLADGPVVLAAVELHNAALALQEVDLTTVVARGEKVQKARIALINTAKEQPSFTNLPNRRTTVS